MFNPLTFFDSLGTKSLQTSATITQYHEAESKRRMREAVVVGCLLAPVVLGLIISSRRTT